MKKEKKIIKIMPLNEHWYESPKKKGVFYPSVSMVNIMPKGKFFDKYMAEQESYEEAQKLLREAGERGSRVHKASEILESGESIRYGEDALGLTDEEYDLLQGFIDWHHKHEPKCLSSELRLISDKMKLGGTADRVYKIGDELVLFDLKTSKSAIYDYHWTQVAAYAKMYEELYKKKIAYTAILRLTKKRKDGYEYAIHENWADDYKQFKNNYETFKYTYGDKKIEPKILEIPVELKL